MWNEWKVSDSRLSIPGATLPFMSTHSALTVLKWGSRRKPCQAAPVWIGLPVSHLDVIILWPHWKDEVWNACMLFSRQGICELRTQCSVHRFKSIHVMLLKCPVFSSACRTKTFSLCFLYRLQSQQLKFIKVLFSITYCTSDQVLWSSLKTHTFFHSVSCFCVFTSSLYIIMSCYFFPSAIMKCLW